MMRVLALVSSSFLALAPLAALAQTTDSEFRDYAAYEAYVDDHVMARKFVPLIQTLGGRDEFTKEELALKERQLLGVWQRDFTEKTVFGRTDLGGGVWQEGRMYWTGKSYAFFYALLHQRADKLVVINFLLNSSSRPILERL